MGKRTPHKSVAPALRIGSLSCLHFHLNLSSFGKKYLADSLYIQGVSGSDSNASCSPTSHIASSWLQYLAESQQISCITWAGGDLCNVCIPEIWLKGHSSGGIIHLLWLGRLKSFKTCSETRKKIHKGQKMQDRSKGGGESFLINL